MFYTTEHITIGVKLHVAYVGFKQKFLNMMKKQQLFIHFNWNLQLPNIHFMHLL